MRWPGRRPPAGTVYIRDAEYAGLLEADARGRELRTEIAAAEAALMACELASGLSSPGERALVDSLAAAPPLTAGGDLHKPAFRALVDQAVWAHRQEALDALLDQHPKESR